MNSAIYKLKQKYPSLPCDWEVGMEVSIGDYKYNFSPMNAKYTDKELSNTEVRNNPEYWEKVVEKSYEILSFKSKYHGNLYIRHQNGLFGFLNDRGYVSDKIVVENTGWEINSVKNSKGEIFTIGDRVNESVASDNNYVWTISEFSLKDSRCFTCGVNINYIQKVKEVLFTTEDGVDIVDPEETICFIDDHFTIYSKKAINAFNRIKVGHHYKYFSTYKAAENFIKLNKPVLSYNDVSELIRKYVPGDIVYRKCIKPDLTKLVKSKL